MTATRLVLVFALSLQGADWLNEGRTQPFEREITPASVKGLQLIWKRKLGDAALSSPVIMGRLITYRGTVELVFVSSADGHVYAVDGDFGKPFWTRELGPSRPVCSVVATPALTPNPPGADPDDDGEQPRRPLFVQAADGMMHSLNPIDGKDDGAARRAPCASALIARNGGAARLKVRRGPVVAGGVAFSLRAATGELEGVDAKTRQLLFRSGPTSPTTSALAVANGHVCFTASDGMLYCFGFPMEK